MHAGPPRRGSNEGAVTTSLHRAGCLMSSGSGRDAIGVELGGTTRGVGATPLDGAGEIGVRSEAAMAALGAMGVADRSSQLIEEPIATVIEEERVSREAIAGIGVGAP